MTANLTTRELLHGATVALAVASQTPQLDAEVLLAHVLGVRRARLQSNAEEEHSAEQHAAYQELVRRRTRGEPVAYIVGAREFWSLSFAVSPAVLVPRPETELLVERALQLGTPPDTRALDLGTGAGPIAIALAHERSGWRVSAIDISAAALALAAANARAAGVPQIEFLCGSWFEPLGARLFELIIANPPYVAADDPALREPPLCYEPPLALTPAGDALSDLRHIIHAAPAHLTRGGWLLLEHGAAQAQEVARELVVRGFRHVRSRHDLAGHERMIEAQWGDPLPPTA